MPLVYRLRVTRDGGGVGGLSPCAPADALGFKGRYAATAENHHRVAKFLQSHTSAVLRDVFQALDANGDGRIDFVEFCALFERIATGEIDLFDGTDDGDDDAPPPQQPAAAAAAARGAADDARDEAVALEASAAAAAADAALRARGDAEMHAALEARAAAH